MSDMKLRLKINRLVLHSGHKKQENMLCSLMKIIQMRHKEVDKQQALRVTREVLQEEF